MVKISQLPQLTTPTTSDKLPSVSGGVTDYSTLTNLITTIASNIVLNYSAIGGLSNPYKFSAVSTTNRTTGNSAFAIIIFETEEYDTNSNYNAATGVYTAPVNGFYHFEANLSFDSASNDIIISLYKNGADYRWGNRIKGASSSVGVHVSSDMQLTAGDTIAVYAFGSNNTTDETQKAHYFSGRLTSLT